MTYVCSVVWPLASVYYDHEGPETFSKQRAERVVVVRGGANGDKVKSDRERSAVRVGAGAHASMSAAQAVSANLAPCHVRAGFQKNNQQSACKSQIA